MKHRLSEQIFLFFEKNFLKGILLFCVICCVVLLYLKANLSISYHPDISGSERSTIFGVQQACANQVIYQDPESYPFWIHNYSSAYFYLCKFFNYFLNWDSTNAHRMYFLSRLVSTLLVFSSLFIFFRFCTRIIKTSPIVSSIFTLFLFSILQFWRLTNSRVDSLLLLCTVSFIYIAAIYIKKTAVEFKINKWLIFLLLITAFAPFVKQSGLILIVAFCAFLFWTANYKMLITSSLIWIILFALFFFIFSYPSPSYFTSNLLANFSSPLSAEWFYYNTFLSLFSFSTFIVVMSILVSFKWVLLEKDYFKVFLSICTFIFFGFAAGTTFKHGSGVGYFHEFIVVALFSILYYCGDNLSQKTKELSTITLATISISIFYISVNEYMLQRTFNLATFEDDYSEQRMVKNYMDSKLKTGDAVFIFCGERQRGGMLQHMLFKNTIAIQDDLINFTFVKHKINYTKLFNYLNSNKVKYLIVDGNQKTYFYGLNYNFNLKKYNLETTIGNYKIYISKL